jgi:hypothetical protein
VPWPPRVLPTRAFLWPLVTAVIGAAAIVIGWFTAWQYDSSAKSLLSGYMTGGEKALLVGVLLPALVAPVVGVAFPGPPDTRRARVAWWSLLLLAGAAIGVVLANVAHYAGGPLGAGPFLAVAGGLAIVTSSGASLLRAPPATARRLGDALAAAFGIATTLLLTASPLSDYGSDTTGDNAIGDLVVGLATFGAVLAAGRFLAPRVRAQRGTALAVAAIGAIASGAAAPPGDTASFIAALLMAAAAVSAAG